MAGALCLDWLGSRVAERLGMGSFAFAFIVFRHKEERECDVAPACATERIYFVMLLVHVPLLFGRGPSCERLPFDAAAVLFPAVLCISYRTWAIL